jgi:glycosyltransferase involved in cell wall biosynthesis
MPAYNVERYISEAIQSVIAQTYPLWELIIVDDGSTDATAEIARRFADYDNRIKYLFQANQKQARARNTGIKQAGGDLVAFLDADDLWIREKLDLQVRALSENAVDLVFSDGFVFQEGDTGGERTIFSTPVGEFSGAEMFAELMRGNRIPVLSVLVRRKVLEDVGCFDEAPRYHGLEDYDLWLTIARRDYRFYGMAERLVRYRARKDSTSSQIALMLKSELATVEKHQRRSKQDKQRLKSLRMRAAVAVLDQYFLSMSFGRLGQGAPYFFEAFGLSPLTICHPRRIGAVIKHAALAARISDKN